MNRRANHRRRPGDLWGVWRVHRRGALPSRQAAIGYVVTSAADRSGKPIAFVPGIAAASLRKARTIAANADRARTAIDLRRRTGRRFFRPLIGGLLLPVDRRGRVIGNDKVFAAAMYTPVGSHDGAGMSFYLMTHYGLQLAKEERGASLGPITPMLGGGQGETAQKRTAA